MNVALNTYMRFISRHGSSLGMQGLPEIVETLRLFFNANAISLPTMVYCLMEIEAVHHEYFELPKCPDPSNALSMSETNRLVTYLHFALASYHGTYYTNTQEFFEVYDAAQAAAWVLTSIPDRICQMIDSFVPTADSRDMIRLHYPKVMKEPFRCCYYMLDHVATGEIIVAFRGTLSMPEVMTDLVASTMPFMGGHAHKGMFLTAKNMYPEIKEALRAYLGQYSRKTVTFVGHSLGAGIAAIMAMMCRDEFSVKAVAFACPSVFTQANVEASKELVTSVVMGGDLIPRLSYKSYEQLAKVMYEMFESSVPPSVVMHTDTRWSKLVPMYIRKKMHKKMQHDFLKRQHEHQDMLREMKREYWRARHDSGLSDTEDSDLDEDLLLGVFQPVQSNVNSFRKKIVNRLMRSKRQAELEARIAAGDNDEINIFPLYPAGRMIQLANLTREADTTLRASVSSWSGRADAVETRPRSNTRGFSQRVVTPTMLKMNPLNEFMRRFGGLDERLMFAYDSPNELAGTIVIHPSSLVQHHPLVYLRALTRCAQSQEILAGYGNGD
ncbi:Lipase (class 3) [Carpediemonas membranifera]|uniref:sn-1-specific diacylglycerol lipase n=1 Tax=Carpediemonas membranifera TaxID=201153 RepID=A0A8J6B507_9EUKA|nr:Lipase (class 3) [Carpediemonas membranifera]|eukprot:KAG9395808.1 Lipase (class 3) [Carpediemonas membranifera]